MFEYTLLFLVKNPCETTKEDEKQCCNKWTKNIGNNLKSIMKVMRFANHRGRSSYDLNSMIPNANDKLGSMQKHKITAIVENKNKLIFILPCNFHLLKVSETQKQFQLC